MDIITYKLAQKYANSVAAGFSSVSVDGTTITFTLNDGKTASVTVPTPADGVSIADVDLNEYNHLICTMSDGNTIDAGEIPVGKGIRNIEKTSTSGLVDTYTINYTDNTTSNYQVTNGANATINGLNSLYLVAGAGIKLTQDGNRIIISLDGTPPSPSEGEQLTTSNDEIFLTSDNYNFIVKEGE